MVRRRRFGRQHWNRFGKDGVFLWPIAGHLCQAAREEIFRDTTMVVNKRRTIYAGAERESRRLFFTR